MSDLQRAYTNPSQAKLLRFRLLLKSREMMALFLLDRPRMTPTRSAD
jgi:hypothetical protein